MALTDQSGVDVGSSDASYLPLVSHQEATNAAASVPQEVCVAEHLLALASRIEPNGARRALWWAEDAINELDGLTAAELVRRGANDMLEAFLEDILGGSRG